MNRHDVIRRQAALLIEAMSQHVSHGQQYALVDFPDYANVGDSAIWLGARQALRSIAGRDPAYVCSYKTYEREALRAALDANAPIFIIGGGNFGDIYPQHQNFRIALMRDNPGRPIIQMPQSIAFRGSAATTAEAIAAHGHFHLYVRDHASADFASRQLGVTARLAPDCAFALRALERRTLPSFHYVFLRRSDGETTGTDYSPLSVIEPTVFDWATEPPLPQSALKGRAILSGAPSLDRAVYKGRFLDAKAEWRLERGLGLLSQGETVITDRLHGHILSVLLGIPDVALDNSTGKVSAYHDCWMGDLPLHVVAPDVPTALKEVLRITRQAVAA